MESNCLKYSDKNNRKALKKTRTYYKMAELRKELRKENSIKRCGEVNINSHNSKMKIIKYINHADVVIEFENGYITHASYKNFKIGSVKSPYCKSVYNIGYLGIGEYKTSVGRINTEQYKCWRGMLKRCYDVETIKRKNVTYKDCTVCEEWHNFQNFAKWYDENYYEIDGFKMELDKDIIKKGNKIYSPETCAFVPFFINGLFTKTNALRGDFPIGVYYRKDCNKYVAQCNNGTKSQKYLGQYNSPIEAFESYKLYKENYIKQVANEYKDKIPQILYYALYRYEVEITD